MPFSAEDGSGKADANSIVDLGYLDAYHTLRQNTAWLNLTIEKKQAHAVYATDYVRINYSTRIYRQRFKSTQRLPFPTTSDNGETADAIPEEVKEAVAELAFISITTSLFSRKSGNDTRVKIESTIGPITDKWAPGLGVPNASPTFDYIDKILAPFLTGGRTSGPVYVERV